MSQTAMFSQPVHDVRFLCELKAPTRDKKKLSVDLFLPRNTSNPFPTIFWRTPYESLLQMHIEWAIWWAQCSYAVAI